MAGENLTQVGEISFVFCMITFKWFRKALGHAKKKFSRTSSLLSKKYTQQRVAG